MNYPTLTRIGKLGGLDSEGYHHVMIKPDYRNMFSGLEDVYLIFNSDRVFYVTIVKKKQSERKTWVKFLEDGIAEEQPKHKDVILAIAQDAEVTTAAELDALLGYQVVFGEESIGTIEDYFYNGAQYVLQICDRNGKELLIPYVDHYIQSVLSGLQSVTLQNASELIALYQSESVPE
ncbi:MAG: hypothetical protein PHO32_04800 [Candidatus Cloacimonetes bacterium]|nr:hypothetical protein [Candidatus Cloacimonadota bacterium]